jgi:hypothetical protein
MIPKPFKMIEANHFPNSTSNTPHQTYYLNTHTHTQKIHLLANTQQSQQGIQATKKKHKKQQIFCSTQ